MCLSVVTFDFGFLSVIAFSKTKPNQPYVSLGNRLIDLKNNRKQHNQKVAPVRQ